MLPAIPTQSNLKDTYRFTNHRAELYDSVPSKGMIIYKYVVAVIPEGEQKPRMFITCETNPIAVRNREAPFICVYTGYLGGSHLNCGNNSDWDDIYKFAAKAREMICEMLDEKEIVLRGGRLWWRFWG